MWVSVDTVAPRVKSIATPTFDPGIGIDPLPITITFTEAVSLVPADYGTKVRFEQTIDETPVPVPATMSVTCAGDPAAGQSVRTRASMPATGPVNAPLALPAVTTRSVTPCEAGAIAVAIHPAEALYPGSTYTAVSYTHLTLPTKRIV